MNLRNASGHVGAALAVELGKMLVRWSLQNGFRWALPVPVLLPIGVFAAIRLRRWWKRPDEEMFHVLWPDGSIAIVPRGKCLLRESSNGAQVRLSRADKEPLGFQPLRVEKGGLGTHRRERPKGVSGERSAACCGCG